MIPIIVPTAIRDRDVPDTPSSFRHDNVFNIFRHLLYYNLLFKFFLPSHTRNVLMFFHLGLKFNSVDRHYFFDNFQRQSVTSKENKGVIAFLHLLEASLESFFEFLNLVHYYPSGFWVKKIKLFIARMFNY